MREIERATWSPAQRALWDRIAGHPFERPELALDFTRRLARERGWSLDYARGAVREYRRFCFLTMVSDEPVTPSEEVDEVWHQHLTFTRDYWDLWCGQVLRGALHHDPTAGGQAEGQRFRAQYAETLALYESHFGPPDLAFWPAAHRRFRRSPRYRIVDADCVVILPRPALPRWLARTAPALCLALAGLIATPPPAIAQALNPLDWTAEPFLVLYVTLVAAAFIFAIVQDRRLRRGGGPPPARDLDLLELAWLTGGEERAASTVMLALLNSGAARLRSPVVFGGLRGAPQLDVDDRSVVLPAAFEPFRGAVRGAVTLEQGIALLAPRLEPTRRMLVRLGLIPSEETRAQMRRLVVFVFGTVVALGLAKVGVGHSRDKPVGFLILLIVLTLAVGVSFYIAQAHPRRTASGDAALERTRQRHARAASSPHGSELLFAYALTGPAVLAGTHLAEFQRLQRKSGNGPDSSCGCSGDGGGGCGGGGD